MGVFAIDFDGTLCKDAFPNIGEPNQAMIDRVIQLKDQGHEIILWTCRTGKLLDEAVNWCNQKGLFFHAVNENLPRLITQYNNDCRKISCDYFIDDRNLSIDDFLRGEEIVK